MERCTSPSDRDSNLENLKEKLIDREYPETLVNEQIDRAKQKNMKQLIFNQRKQKSKGDNKVRLIFTQNKANPPIHYWIRDCKKLLCKNEEAKELGDRIQICSRQPRNLLRIAGGYKGGQDLPSTPPDAGCFRCNHCKVSCPVMNEAKSFKSTNTGKSYKIRQRLDCDSDWLIYLVTCKKCQGQYVGKSKTPFKIRHSNHKQEIKKDKGGLGHHYGSKGVCNYSDVSVTLIEQVKHKNLEFLANRETWWQHQLRVFVQNGGKAHCFRKDFKK